MSDALERVLRLVAEGRLTAAEAAPILDALGASDAAEPTRPSAGASPAAADAVPTHLRIEVTDAGRKIVNLRIPVSLGPLALEQVPGMSASTVDLVRRALGEGRSGTLLEIDEEDDGVRIVLE